MADDNRPLKYARYAIGEIALVVIGILIAIQINAIKQEADNRKQERFYLNKLKDNFVQDTLLLSIRIRALDTTRVLLNSIVDDIRDLKKDSFSDRNGITALLGTYAFYPEKSTFDNLTATGKLDLLSNSVLVDSIHVYYNFINNRSHTWNEAIASYSRNTIAPHILKLVPVFQNYTSNNLLAIQTKGASPNDLSNDIFLKNLLGFKLNAIEELQIIYHRLNKQALNLIELIDGELDK